MKWDEPPVIKVYEALGSVSDGRVKIDGNNAKVFSSSGNKYYDVTYDPETNAITSNDNGSYWKGYLGYPMIAFLMIKKILPYNEEASRWLNNFRWKDINTKFNNDFAKTEDFIRKEMVVRGANLEEFDKYTKEVIASINKLGLNKLKNLAKPPSAY